MTSTQWVPCHCVLHSCRNECLAQSLSQKRFSVSCLAAWLLFIPGLETVPLPHPKCKSYLSWLNFREKAKVKVLLSLSKIPLPGQSSLSAQQSQCCPSWIGRLQPDWLIYSLEFKAWLGDFDNTVLWTSLSPHFHL